VVRVTSGFDGIIRNKETDEREYTAETKPALDSRFTLSTMFLPFKLFTELLRDIEDMSIRLDSE
jgi:hypothetical protein